MNRNALSFAIFISGFASTAGFLTACGVKAAPTPVMQGFEPRYEAQVEARRRATPTPTSPSAPTPTPTSTPAP